MKTNKRFFSPYEIKRAKTKPLKYLIGDYEKSEKRLNQATRTGKVSSVKKAMRRHHYFEYSMLYRKILDSRRSK